METYIDKLAPWEERSAYYIEVKLGRKVKDLKILLKNQTEKMIASQITSADEIVASQGISEDIIQEIGYDIKSIGLGMSGLKAAFEWGISDVVWLLEKNTDEFQTVMMNLYKVPDKQLDDIRYKLDDTFATGDMESALERFREIETFIKDDFSVCISLGIIYFFHKLDKEKALIYFERAIKYARPYSAYYTSFALLYKALIKRDFGLIEEAERCSGEAIKFSPGFTEAIYQNAQYNALLDRPEKAITLLRKAIKEDIVYCLKILREQDFKQISSEIAKLYEEIRGQKIEKVKQVMEEVKKNVLFLDNAVKNIEKLGYDVSLEFSVELYREGNREIDLLVQKNSIFDAHIAGILLSLLPKKLNREKELLKRRGNQIHMDLDKQIKELSDGMTGKKKRGGPIFFIIHFLCGQIVAFPFGLYIGMPLGLCITEGLLFAICFYVNIIQPQSQWKEVGDKQSEQEKLLRVMKKI
ncbi:tetratricopeptide repeat protein [Candidatus Scalindua japonica]|nr:hypothetical protein [Candidatus Scalindua japonica]